MNKYFDFKTIHSDLKGIIYVLYDIKKHNKKMLGKSVQGARYNIFSNPINLRLKGLISLVTKQTGKHRYRETSG